MSSAQERRDALDTLVAQAQAAYSGEALLSKAAYRLGYRDIAGLKPSVIAAAVFLVNQDITWTDVTEMCS